MMRLLLLSIFITWVMGLQASTLQLYRDLSFYSYNPKNNFVGFAPKGTKAECKSEAMTLSSFGECPKNSRLCKEKSFIELYEKKALRAKEQMRIIDTFLKQTHIEKPDAKTIIKDSKTIGIAYAYLLAGKKRLESIAKQHKRQFLEQAPSFEALYLPPSCGNKVKLVIPGGYINFNIIYEADISKSKQMTVKEHIMLKNRSGIDIHADWAMLYYELSNRAIRPLHFYPWIIKDSSTRRVRPLNSKILMNVADAAKEAKTISFDNTARVAPRFYKISRLDLPSTGKKMDVTVSKRQVIAKKSEVVYPYRDLHVYKKISFIPKNVIESNRWKIKSNGKLVNGSAYGEYIDGRYTLYTSVDDDIVVSREKMIFKNKETGIFGKTIRKKDGYTIQVVNQSTKDKSLQIIERIPVAIRSDVKVKLLNITSNDTSMHYKLNKKGKVTIYLFAKAKQRIKVDLLFEVSYDKDKPIVF